VDMVAPRDQAPGDLEPQTPGPARDERASTYSDGRGTVLLDCHSQGWLGVDWTGKCADTLTR
jgi:hypothetical protein